MPWSDAKQRPADLAAHELLLVEAWCREGIFGLMDALDYSRERYLTGDYAAQLVRRAASELRLEQQLVWCANRLGSENIRPVLARAVELAFAESGLTSMPDVNDAADRLQREADRQRDARLNNTVFRCIVRASVR